MVLARSPLRRVTILLVAALLFAQWAAAAYVCPRGVAADNAAAMVVMPDCAGMPTAAMDPKQPQLCKAHCEHGKQSVNATSNPAPATAFSLFAVLDWHRSATLPARGGPPPGPDDASASAPPGTPPIYLILRVLRD